jgi:hypothetical protein
MSLLSFNRLYALCAEYTDVEEWSKPPPYRVLASLHDELLTLVGRYAGDIEAIAAVLYVFSLNEYKLGEAAYLLPVVYLEAQVGECDIRLTERQVEHLEEIQTRVAEGDLSWDETLLECKRCIRNI